MRTHLLVRGILVAAGALASAQAQAGAGQPGPQTRPAVESPARQGQAASTTLVGCLYRERDIPGRQPNAAERAGMLEDYILADARHATGAATAGTASGTVGTSGGTTSTARHAGSMYKVEHLDDNYLRRFVGKRIEVTGRIDEDDAAEAAGTTGTTAPRTDRSIGPDSIELPEFEAVSVREVSGSCPAHPEASSGAHSAAPVTRSPSHPATNPEPPQTAATGAPVTQAPSYPGTAGTSGSQTSGSSPATGSTAAAPAAHAPATRTQPRASGSQPQGSSGTARQPAAAGRRATITLAGCLYEEAAVPGRRPNVAERAGVLEDYILADAQPVGSQPAQGGTAGAVGTSGTAGAALPTMYKVEHIDDNHLRRFLGRRVEVTGHVDQDDNDTAQAPTAAGGTAAVPKADRGPGPDSIELPEFEAVAIREVAGNCPARPEKQ